MVRQELKPKRCRICKETFQPVNTLHIVCSFGCTVENTRRRAEKRQAAEKAKSQKIRAEIQHDKTTGLAVQNAQIAINAFARARDYGKPCASCGQYKPHTAGHFRSVGSTPELRFNTKNIFGQCSTCNSGHYRRHHNAESIRASFESEVIRRHGQGYLDWLNGPHKPKQYRLEDLNRIRWIFTRRAKHYRKLRGTA